MDLLPKPIKRNVKVFFGNIWLDWERIGQLQSFDLFSAMAVFLSASQSDVPLV